MDSKKKKKFADYVLSWDACFPVVVVETKENNYSASHSMQQALGYAEILEEPSALNSNSNAFASPNKVPQDGEDIETEFAMESFPTPDELWQRYKILRNIEEPLHARSNTVSLLKSTNSWHCATSSKRALPPPKPSTSPTPSSSRL